MASKVLWDGVGRAGPCLRGSKGTGGYNWYGQLVEGRLPYLGAECGGEAPVCKGRVWGGRSHM